MRLWLVAAAIVVTLAALALYGREQRANGALVAEITRLTSDNKALTTRATVARVVFVRDTVRLTRTVTRWETVRDSVLGIDVDERPHRARVDERPHATVPDTGSIVPTPARVLAAAADTAIRECKSVVRSCGAALALSDSLLANREQLIRAMRKQQPTFVDKARTALVWTAAGYLAGRLTK